MKNRQGPQTKCIECPVRKMALFKNVPEDRLSWTQEYRRAQQVVGPKEHLYMEGDDAPYVYTVYSGWVKLYKMLNNGKKQVLRFALPGDFIGFQGELLAPMRHSAQALTNTVVCAFPRARVLDMFEQEPSVATEMIRMNAIMMDTCQEYLLSNGVRNAKQRISFLLLDLYTRLSLLDQFRPEFTEDSAIPIPITQDDIADAVGMTPIHVNRTLNQMKMEGLVRCANHKLEIRNHQALAKLADYDAESNIALAAMF